MVNLQYRSLILKRKIPLFINFSTGDDFQRFRKQNLCVEKKRHISFWNHETSSRSKRVPQPRALEFSIPLCTGRCLNWPGSPFDVNLTPADGETAGGDTRNCVTLPPPPVLLFNASSFQFSLPPFANNSDYELARELIIRKRDVHWINVSSKILFDDRSITEFLILNIERSLVSVSRWAKSN